MSATIMGSGSNGRRNACCCALLCLGVLGLHVVYRRKSGSLAGDWAPEAVHKQATWEQVSRALGWSMVSGLATGVGGAVVFCLEPPDHGSSSEGGVSNRTMAALLGLAVGVMLVLSIDLVVPPMRAHGLRVAALPIAAGVGTIYMLDALVQHFGCADAMGGHGHSHGGGMGGADDKDKASKSLLPIAGSRSGKGAAGAAAAAAAAAARARSALLTALALAAHNAPEGLAVGMASLQESDNKDAQAAADAAGTVVGTAAGEGGGVGSESQPQTNVILVVVAIALHNIPEGVAVAVALFNSSGRRAHSCMMSTMTGLVEPLSAVLAVLVLAPFLTQTTLDCSLMYVGGVMVTVSVRELVSMRFPGLI